MFGTEQKCCFFFTNDLHFASTFLFFQPPLSYRQSNPTLPAQRVEFDSSLTVVAKKTERGSKMKIISE